jgi:large subunit ribosomal protein L15
MNLNSLKPAAGSVRKTKRIARGTGSGHGGTSTRGHKGAKARSGFKSKRGHEGGQMPLQMRLPKSGFKNTHSRYKSYYNNIVTLNLSDLQKISDKHNLLSVTPEILVSLGYISNSDTLKVLGSGQLNKALHISASLFSESAKKSITNSLGKYYFVLKTNQIQGIVNISKTTDITPSVLSGFFTHISDNEQIHVVQEGSLSLTFNLSAHKFDNQVLEQFNLKGAKCSLLS